MTSWIWLVLAIVGEVVATSALKASDGFTRLVPSTVVVLGYGITFLALSHALKTLPVGLAYAVWAGVGMVLVTLIAWRVYGQKLDAWAIFGMALIISGVCVMNLLSTTTPH